MWWGLVQAHGGLREAFRWAPRNSFVLVEFEEGGGVFEVAALALEAVGSDVADVG